MTDLWTFLPKRVVWLAAAAAIAVPWPALADTVAAEQSIPSGVPVLLAIFGVFILGGVVIGLAGDDGHRDRDDIL